MRKRASFRLRLFLGLVFLTAIGVGLQFWVFGSMAEHMRQDAAARDLTLARVLAQGAGEALTRSDGALKALAGQLEAGLGGAELVRTLEAIPRYDTLVRQALVLGPDGSAPASGSLPPDRQSPDFSSRPVFSSALSHPGVTFVDCFQPEGAAMPAVSLMTGVAGRVAVLSIRSEEILRRISTLPSPDDGFLALLDPGGELVARSAGPEWPGEDAARLTRLAQEGLKDDEGVWRGTAGGVQGVYSIHRLSWPGWLGVVFEPEAKAYAGMDVFYGRMLFAVAVVTVMALLVMYVFQDHLLGPIARLTAQVEAVSEGRADAAVEPVLMEFEPLAESVSVMLAGLRARERALDENRRRLAAVVDAMPSFLAATGADDRVEQWNVEAEKLTLVPAEQALGKHLEDAVPALAVILPALARSSLMGISVKWEKLSIDFGAGVRFVDVLVYPLSPDGEGGAVIRIDDITDRIRMEEVMVHSEKMMTVGGLAAGMAHEINNPLGGILMTAQNLIRRLSPDLPANREAAREAGVDLDAVNAYLKKREVFDYAETIRKLGDRAGKIVSHMLGFSRRSHSGLIPVRIEEVVERAMELAANDYDLKKNIDFKAVAVHLDIAQDLDCVPMNRNQIEQVMLNLFKNAAQAMSHSAAIRPPELWVTARRVSDEAVIEVRDNGPGIPENVRERIFEPFYTTKPVGEGTGLGLSVSYYIVTTMHNGDITVSSQPDRGTTFTIRLPLRRKTKNTPESEIAA